jgi:chorismate dehydratase
METGEGHLPAMLAHADAALVIGDNALLDQASLASLQAPVERIDLGETWTMMTGLPFVWALWAGRADTLGTHDVLALQEARNRGVAHPDAIAREYFRNAPQHVAIGGRYLRDNIKYHLGEEERAGLETFYQYAAEARLVARPDELRFF